MGEVHDLLEATGHSGTRCLVEGRRGPRIIAAAANWSADEDLSTGYIYSGWCQTALPHRRPFDNSANWRHDNEHLTLIVRPGSKPGPGGSTIDVGVPFGAIARLILIYLQSEALRTGRRDIELGGSLRGFLKRLGIAYGGNTTRLVREQAERISRCTMSFHSQRNGVALLVNQTIVDKAMLLDALSDDLQGSLFVETARLSETFFEQLQRHAVPLDETAIRHIRNSSMALDVYCWLAYRLHVLQTDLAISWTALAGQFGAGFQQRKHFKAAFSDSLRLALAVYAAARVEQTNTGLVLKPSPPPIRKLMKA